MPSVAFALVLAFGFFLGLAIEPLRWFIWIGMFGLGFGLRAAARYASEAPGLGIARRVIGISAAVSLILLAYFIPAYVMATVLLNTGSTMATAANNALFAGLAGLALYFFFRRNIREYAGRIAAPFIRIVRQSRLGQGGAAAFGGLLEEWRTPFKAGGILVGSSFYQSSWRVGLSDDRGLLTIASSRSGKGRSAIIPNLLIWPGSALVIDPKGTNAAVTAARRGRGGGRVTAFLGQDVHIVDPFGIVSGTTSASYNPLAHIDMNGDRVTEDIGLLADALVVPGASSDSHWEDCARAILAGVIAHMLARSAAASLIDLRDAFRQGADELDEMFAAMQAGQGGKLAATAAALFQNAGLNERGSFMTTVTRNIGWLDSAAMQKVLAKSDFSLGDLKQKPMTVYVVLPPEYLDEHKRFLRLFVNMTIRSLSHGGKGKQPVLFLLDEFYSLGKIRVLETAAGLLPSYGMKLWPIVQNLTQLKHLYPQNWETFIANAGLIQVFSVNDKTTADYLASTLGKRVKQEKIGEQVRRTVAALREPEDFNKDVGRDSRRQIILRSGADPLVLRRLQYDTDFPRNWFNPDPDFGRPEPVALLPAPDRMPPLPAAPSPTTPAQPSSSTLLDYMRKHNLMPTGQAETQPLFPLKSALPPSDPYAELDALTGLAAVKAQARAVVAQAEVMKAREKAGLPVANTSRHLVFTGNPGTGKTTVARIIGKIYQRMGVLKKGHMVEVSRPDLIGEHVGATAPKVQAVVQSALDGVLFIDEAYSLVADLKYDFGPEAVATLIKMMEDNRDRLIVIAAGYKNDMDAFIASNPGLKSRFKTFIDFPDYTAGEMAEIFGGLCAQYQMALTEEAEDKVIAQLRQLELNKGADFGNARDVRNLFEMCLERQAVRLANEKRTDRISLSELTAADIPGEDIANELHEFKAPSEPVPVQGSGRVGMPATQDTAAWFFHQGYRMRDWRNGGEWVRPKTVEEAQTIHAANLLFNEKMKALDAKRMKEIKDPKTGRFRSTKKKTEPPKDATLN